MVLETNTTHTMDINGHKQDDPRAGQTEKIAGREITRQQISYFGHIMRANSLETTLMFGMVIGRRRRGWQRTPWMDTIKAHMNLPMKELKEVVKDRKAWRMIIHKVTESRLRLNG